MAIPLVLHDDRGLSLPLKTKSTKCEASHFPVELENCQNTEDKFRNLQTIMEHIKIMIITEENGLLSDMKTKIEHILLSTDIYVLQEYLHTLDTNKLSSYLSGEKIQFCLFCLITYHVLVTSEKENSIEILKAIKVKLQQRWNLLYFPLEQMFLLYLSMYYKDNPNEIFTDIHTIWKYEPTTELELKLAYCKKLMKAKHSKTLVQLIHHHADYFKDSFEVALESNLYIESTTTTMVLFHILHHQVSINKMEKVKRIETILSRILKYRYYGTFFLLDGFHDFILTLDNIQILSTPYLFKFLQPLMKDDPYDFLKTILLCSNRLRQAHHYTECIKFIKCHFEFVSSFPTSEVAIKGECYYRQQYCITMLLLLNDYVSCYDTHKMNLVLTRLLQFRVSFLSDMHSNSCYCFMGNQECSNILKYSTEAIFKLTYDCNFKIEFNGFKQKLLDCYRRRQYCRLPSFSPFGNVRIPHSGYAHELHDFNLVIKKVIQGQLELAPCLQSMIDVMSMNEYEDELVVFFMEFIKRSADHNAATLYDIIKFLCAHYLQPEIQDLILQVLTGYLMISCNRQYGLLSKFILDISMICPNGQFLHKLTSGIATLSLKFDNDTVNDFRKIIYKCYCTVRHDSKNEKDTNIMNIARYKDHYTFIASMEAEDEMKKLTDLTNLLLMLTLLLITSGGHHKSAELKKYLSLKYEYRDSILYLLWCSGDVEINPGPTLCTLRKLPDSVKERNWLYEMCSILLRLLKYRSIDLKNDGLWKEKPLQWPSGWSFYDPRNKPKGQGYNTGTDKKLLECLVEHCHSEGLFNNTSKFDDEQAKSKVRQYEMEIIAWKNNRLNELFELYILRQELDTLRAAKKSLHKYKNDPELYQHISDLNVDLIFDTDNVTYISSEGYTDIVRDIAITFCRIGKGLSPLEKSDGIWKTPPSGWNPNHSYYSPCNAGKRKEKGQYQKLVNNLLTYCDSMNITIPSELQPLIKAWKQRKTSEITKSYTIWSKTAIVKHVLQYLELEGMLGKIHVQEHLKQIGVILDTQCWRCPSVKKSCTSDNDDKSQDSSFSDHLHSSPSSYIETNSTSKVASLQIHSDHPCIQFPDSTQTHLNEIPASPHSLVSHTDGHLCNIDFDQQSQWNQYLKHTCVNSFIDSHPILTRKTQSEADDKYQPISTVNSLNLNEQLIPCTVHIHDATSKPDSNNKISKTAKKRQRRNNDESCSEPKRLHVSEEDIPLLLQVSTSSSENGKDMAITSPKGNSKDCTIRTIIPDHLSHDLISIKSRPNLPASEKQTDQLVINELHDTSDDKPVDSSSCKQADNANKKGETTLDQCENQIVNLLEEKEQDYSATVVEQSSGHSSSDRSRDGEIDNADINIQTTSNFFVDRLYDQVMELDPDNSSATLEAQKLSPCPSTDQPSDYSDGFPEHFESIIDELLNNNDTHNIFSE